MFRHISSVIVVVLCALGISSCDRTGSYGGGGAAEQYKLVIHISPVNAVDGQAAVNVTEKIRTLRVIVLNETELECNKLITVDDPETVVAARFRYDFALATTKGPKEIYLIGNEASVTNIEYQSSGGTLPDGLPDNLKELVENYEVGAASAEFRTVINSVYFAPDYTPDALGDLYLPYVSYYNGIEAKEDDLTTVSMYIVPVATKFTFDFVNNRENEVEINNITVAQTDSHHFLMAHVGSRDYKKDFGGTDYYWIDWLAKISEELQKYGGYYDNSDFNTLFGWITDYAKPETSELSSAVMINSATSVRVPARKGETAGELVLGPFYMPESRNDVTYKDSQNNDVTEQIYYLTLGLHDVTASAERDPKFDDVVISNLKSLFRNMNVVIRVSMSQGDVAIYAEIADWTKRFASGWIVEGNESPEIK